MMIRSRPARGRQRGLVLISSLLLLVVVTVLAVGLFRSFGTQERIAGNLREKGRAVAAAETALNYAEWWLIQGNGSTGTTCNTKPDVSTVGGLVCSNQLLAPIDPATPSTWPGWVTYTPNTPTAMTILAAPTPNSYSLKPAFYIAYLGLSPTGNGAIYQIDAAGYGGTQVAAAVVESTYLVQSSVKDLGAQ